MNIAEKILQLKQDFDNVYKAGQESGGGSGDYQQGYEDGKNSVVMLEKCADTISLIPSTFTAEELTVNLDYASSLNSFWYEPSDIAKGNQTVKRLTVNCKKPIKNVDYAFSSAYAHDNVLEHLTINADTSSVTYFRRTFGHLRAVKVIDGTPLDVSSCVSFRNNGETFVNCDALEYVRFKGFIQSSISFAQSANLSDDTVQHIIDRLADLTGGTAQTLTLHATVGGKLTDTQKAIITAKNWTLVY